MKTQATLAIVLSSMITGACSNMSLPTSPSVTVSAMASTSDSGVAQRPSLEWSATAEGCAPRRPAPVVDGEPAYVRTLNPDELHYAPGAVIAQWLREADSVYAIFHETPAGTHALCFWDTSGI